MANDPALGGMLVAAASPTVERLMRYFGVLPARGIGDAERFAHEAPEMGAGGGSSAASSASGGLRSRSSSCAAVSPGRTGELSDSGDDEG